MLDDSLVLVDRMALEAEGPLEEVDRRVGVVVDQYWKEILHGDQATNAAGLGLG